jgi:arsenate reductase
MAEGSLRNDGGGRFEVHSAGVRPSRVRLEAVKVMREIGLDISSHSSKSSDDIITVCDSACETCPVFPGHAERIHHNFEDP